MGRIRCIFIRSFAASVGSFRQSFLRREPYKLVRFGYTYSVTITYKLGSYLEERLTARN